MRSLPPRVDIREVGPRDGLQGERPVPIEDRARLINALSATGVPKLEAVAFVSPKAVPAMADAAAVWRRVEKRPDVSYSALVPNQRGAEEAVAAGGFDGLQAFLAVTEAYNRRNVGKSVKESIEDVARVVGVARAAEIPVEASLSCAFGDPYEGDVAPDRVRILAEQVVEAGVDALSVADTTGMASPTRVWEVVGVIRERLPDVPVSLHLHDTRGTGIANLLAALEVGLTEFDASVGGLGGSPFAPGANGNIATEDAVHMLTDMGIETGVDLDKVLEAGRMVASLVGHPLASQVSRAGPRWAAGGPFAEA